MDQYAHLRHIYPRAGEPWEPTEDTTLITELTNRVPVNIISKRHERTLGAILARIDKLMGIDSETGQVRRTGMIPDLAAGYDGPWTSHEWRALKQNLATARDKEMFLRAQLIDVERERDQWRADCITARDERDALKTLVSNQAASIAAIYTECHELRANGCGPTWDVYIRLKDEFNVANANAKELQRRLDAVSNALRVSGGINPSGDNLL